MLLVARVDEVHKVKNPSSKTTLAFHQLQCKVRFGLTGTAMQNRYAELHTVLDWCFPGRLGDARQWKDYVDTPLKIAQRKDATQEQIATGRVQKICRICVSRLIFYAADSRSSVGVQFTAAILHKKVRSSASHVKRFLTPSQGQRILSQIKYVLF